MKFQAFVLRAAASIQVMPQPTQFSLESYPCPMWTSLLMTPGQACQSLVWRGLRGWCHKLRQQAFLAPTPWSCAVAAGH